MATSESNDPVIKMRGVHKSFERGSESIVVLEDLELDIQSGDYVSLMGPSGSGKSTLLHLIAGLDKPSKGTVEVAGQQISKMSDGQLAGFRSATIGFVFQTFNLIPVLTAVENVELPLLLTSLGRAERRERAETALRVVGLESRAKHYPRQLSGGQEQRVAIARAIVSDPTIILADEPTGDLDRQSADEVLELFGKLHEEFNKTIVTVTHDPRAAERASVRRRLDKGRLE